MALIACGECGTEISSKAAACPKCGAPPQGKGIVTTQQTSKVFKVMQLVGFILIVAGVVSCVAAPTGETLGSTWTWLMGLALFFAGRVGAWWRNG
ncbi:MAG TPA: zinc ribbon domain-containing protein [Acidovorax sp.]|nr:zinc ribbon domain-containing protein [Acidovorax sp.]